MSLLPTLAITVKELQDSFDEIPLERQKTLQELSEYIREKKGADQPVQLVFICTHNSRRSHMAQMWAMAAAFHFGVNKIACFSGGTEATAFYPAAVKAMQSCGFEVTVETEGENPKYKVKYAADATPEKVWSKRFDDKANPSAGFCAIMTCSDADENCPFVPGAEKRIVISYLDPKESDGTLKQHQLYTERALQIGREMLYAFSKV